MLSFENYDLAIKYLPKDEKHLIPKLHRLNAEKLFNEDTRKKIFDHEFVQELKNVILFDHVQTPHYNYVGDSILGYYSHMGAGSITSNVKADKKLVVVHNGTEQIETGIKKFGAMLGDHVEVGCNAVMNPGTVIGRNSNVYPTSCVRGVVPADSIWKNSGEIIHKGEM